jgi:hypothetical protein
LHVSDAERGPPADGGFYFSGDIFGLDAAEKHILAAQAITIMSCDAEVADRLLLLTARELARKQDQALLLSRSAEDRVIGAQTCIAFAFR